MDALNKFNNMLLLKSHHKSIKTAICLSNIDSLVDKHSLAAAAIRGHTFFVNLKTLDISLFKKGLGASPCPNFLVKKQINQPIQYFLSSKVKNNINPENYQHVLNWFIIATVIFQLSIVQSKGRGRPVR